MEISEKIVSYAYMKVMNEKNNRYLNYLYFYNIF